MSLTLFLTESNRVRPACSVLAHCKVLIGDRLVLLSPAALVPTEFNHLGLDIGHLLVDLLDRFLIARPSLPVGLHLPGDHIECLPQIVDASLSMIDALAVVYNCHLIVRNERRILLKFLLVLIDGVSCLPSFSSFFFTISWFSSTLSFTSGSSLLFIFLISSLAVAITLPCI